MNQTQGEDGKTEQELREEIEVLQKMNELALGLPHIHKYKMYHWMRGFFESRNKMCLLLAANQLGKSSVQIRKCIEWATNKKLWPLLWRNPPNQFWYLYPTKDVATIEFETKWMEYLPAGKYKDDPTYGWRVEWDGGHIFAIHFNSGVSVYFKTYAQDASHLQSGSCYAILCDEELPERIYDELLFRTAATDGYFSMVFTATLGQEFWRETMEEKGEKERFSDAYKLQVSLYDCLEYDDGSPSHWTKERISKIIARCKSEVEIQRRVWGKFVVEEGRKYESFNRSKNMKKFFPIPKDWHIYTAVDPGSGGEKGHPTAICFVAVRPDFKYGAVFRGWRGDGIQTTSTDILDKYRELKAGLTPVLQLYDFQSADFYIVASRQGEAFTKAEKNHKIGEDIINTLFRNEMLVIIDTPELQKLAIELSTLKRATSKIKAKDDFADAMRYCVTKIPWNFSGIAGAPQLDPEGKAPEAIKTLDQLRREGFIEGKEEDLTIEQEFEFWNAAYEP